MLLKSAEIYIPAAGTWTNTPPMVTARYYHAATRLANGKVLVAGGGDHSGPINNAELYKPALGLWTAAKRMIAPHYFHTATLLPNGQVLVAGGYGIGRVYLTSADLYHPPFSVSLLMMLIMENAPVDWGG